MKTANKRKLLGPLMVGVTGIALSELEREMLAHPLIGGVILFSRNYETRRQLIELTNDIRRCHADLIIAVDQEGGRIQRFKSEFSSLPAPAHFASAYRNQSTQKEAKSSAEMVGFTMASELIATGIDISFAPVLDIDTGISQIIGDRSFGDTPDVVLALAGAFIKGMRAAGMSATGKHFPGHGAVVADSHKTLPVDHRLFSVIEARDLQPFQQLSGQLDAIMTAHIVYSAVDTQPATFSHFWLQEVLRKRLGFTGAIISDDLLMAGALAIGGVQAAAEAALQAGCDMLLVCNEQETVISLLDNLHYTPNIACSTRLSQLRTCMR